MEKFCLANRSLLDTSTVQHDPRVGYMARDFPWAADSEGRPVGNWSFRGLLQYTLSAIALLDCSHLELSTAMTDNIVDSLEWPMFHRVKYYCLCLYIALTQLSTKTNSYTAMHFLSEWQDHARLFGFKAARNCTISLCDSWAFHFYNQFVIHITEISKVSAKCHTIIYLQIKYNIIKKIKYH